MQPATSLPRGESASLKKRSVRGSGSTALGSAGFGAAILLFVGIAWASGVRYSAALVTEKSPQHVWSVLTAYKETCEKGCKYQRPNLVSIRKLDYRATASKFYTWSHLSAPVKDAKYFTEVKVQRKSGGHFVSVNRQLDKSDRDLIRVLEKKYGLTHAPLALGGDTTTITESIGNKTKVTQDVTAELGALGSLLEGRIRRGMKESVDATFQNIEQ